MSRKWGRLVTASVIMMTIGNLLNESFSGFSATSFNSKQQHAHQHRYFLYNDTAMARPSNLKYNKKAAVYWREANYENLIHEALVKHHLRTLDPDQADILFVPTPIGQLIGTGPKAYDKAFNALLQAPTYQRLHGHRHVIIALVDHFRNVPFRKWFGNLTNVTIARTYDPNACRDLVAATAGSTENLYQHDYRPLFESLPHVIQTLSIGLPPEPGVPFFPATYEKFVNSSLILF
jgi:hypothetical protein